MVIESRITLLLIGLVVLYYFGNVQRDAGSRKRIAEPLELQTIEYMQERAQQFDLRHSRHTSN